MLIYLLKGLVIGITCAIPIGPVGLLCLDMTVTHGRKAGLCCAIGMVSADICSASLMLLGIHMFESFIQTYDNGIKIFTALLFIAIGVMTFRMRNHQPQKPSSKKLFGLTCTSFLLSITPATFALMMFLFPALGLTENNIPALVLAGVGLGSASWCAFVIGAGKCIRRLLGDKLPRFKSVVGILFIAMGCAGILRTIGHMMSV